MMKRKFCDLACDCHPYGIIDKQCDTNTGMCQCKPHVIGQRCDQCQVFRSEWKERAFDRIYI